MPSRSRNWHHKTVQRQTVNDREYTAWIAAERIDEAGIAHIRVTIRAEYGTKSYCVIRGLTNKHYYSYGWLTSKAWTADEIAITPRAVSRLIPWAHENGWNPAESRANCDLRLNPELAKAIAGLSSE